MSPDHSAPEKIGLREKKKRKTRKTMQQQAMRLFKEQGYHETTIEQIAEASEISPSTFFRYFATKEALVMQDEYDPMLIRNFMEQPSAMNPLQALRAAIHTGLSTLSEAELELVKLRMDLVFKVPELRAASLKQINDSLAVIARIVADRQGLPRDDFGVLTFAGTVLGAIMAVQHHCTENPQAEFLKTLDSAFEQLEAGFPELLKNSGV
ncbi:TetR family transcriptional regulator [Paenibacillus sp. HB172176]|uniref:acyl-CoA-like ligand-binding transcription factor n=1 Tax=Paenibacillus sp. HB172176 TaxID=2493690 RepID=UPI00143ADB49|nr:TetR family transcriptional regulator [Paenibacillus sp. HB172176]